MTVENRKEQKKENTPEKNKGKRKEKIEEICPRKKNSCKQEEGEERRD